MGAKSLVLVQPGPNLTLQSVANTEMLNIPWYLKCKMVVKIKLYTVDTYLKYL